MARRRSWKRALRLANAEKLFLNAGQAYDRSAATTRSSMALPLARAPGGLAEVDRSASSSDTVGSAPTSWRRREGAPESTATASSSTQSAWMRSRSAHAPSTRSASGDTIGGDPPIGTTRGGSGRADPLRSAKRAAPATRGRPCRGHGPGGAAHPSRRETTGRFQDAVGGLAALAWNRRASAWR